MELRSRHAAMSETCCCAPAFLRMGGSGCGRRLSGRRSCSAGILRVIEIDFGSLTRAGLGFEIRVVTSKTRQAGDDVVGEQRDVSVVVLQDLIIVTALDGDAIFRALRFF